eukprot:3859621-Alexandrium_andersonii.AAC.1
MREAARAEGPSRICHSIALEARPADDSGAPIGPSCHHAPAVAAEPEDRAAQGVSCAAYRYIHPAARSALRVQRAASAGEVVETGAGAFDPAGAGRSVDAAAPAEPFLGDLASGRFEAALQRGEAC